MGVDLSKLGIPWAGDVNAKPHAPSKGLPPVLAKKERQQAKKDKDEAFRDAIWKLDAGCSRATKTPLVRGGTMDWNRLGEVDHVINRSTAPELIYDASNGILLSKTENRLKKTPCPGAPEFYMFSVAGPNNRRLEQTFTWRDKNGKVVRRTKG
jgi:hypothetical protein